MPLTRTAAETQGVPALERRAIPVVVRQHLDDAAILHAARAGLVEARHIKLHHLRRFDDRITAHLDGLAIAGDQARPLCRAALEQPAPGAVFVAAVSAVTSRDGTWLKQLCSLADAVPECRPGLFSAFGWSEQAQLHGLVAELLKSSSATERAAGIAACSMHRVDPALGPARRLEDSDALPRARAYRTCGEIGKREFLSRLAAAASDEDESCRFWAAWSAVLLGDRQRGLDHLEGVAMQDGAFRLKAYLLGLIAMSPARAHERVRELAQQPEQIRWVIRGAGMIGDPAYIPWLIEQMANNSLARLGGDSFSLITGADLAALDLERKPPENFESGPNDDPNDFNVAMDEDDGLPWPDVERIARWWAQNSSRFVPGQRYFVGAPVTREHCIEVLKTGYQSQRILAAHHLCLLEPGSVLFEWRAPAWRQAQALAALG
jgi:uncharacterized protein (TIGR02270 family)